ncbi:hypothetical protein KJ966_00235 [bacterium]|nr:hypothetical protein [bacterium]
MTRFKRVRKKNTDIDSIDRTGITRIKDGWLIRLGWENKRPRFQKVIRDKEYNGNHIESYRIAAAIAEENRPDYRSNFKRPTNYIRGLTLARQRSKTKGPKGEIQYYYCWKYTFMENQKQKGRTFSFWLTGQLYESYLKAVGFAIKYEPEMLLGRIDEYFVKYINGIDTTTFKDFVTTSDVKVLNSDSDKLILKNRYLKSNGNSHQNRRN